MIKSGNLLQELFENSGSVVLITDEMYNIRYSSIAVQSILGLEPIALAGKNVFEFAPIDKRDRWKDCLENAGNSKRAEIHLVSATGDDLYFMVTVSNHIAHHIIQGMVIILHDISEQKRKHFQLEKENEHLDQFIFKATHDLRSPIHSAIGILNLLENANEQDRTKYLQLARHSLVKLESLIDEVNKFYLVDKMAVANEKIDLRRIIDGEIAMLQNLPQAQNISFDLYHNIESEIFSDSLRLKAIIGNILSNAVKYSDSKKSHSFVRIETYTSDKEVAVTISDNGIGIAQENLGRIFEIFFRGTSESSGTGLGLHIVKDTVDRLHGTIEVRSQLGTGTQFKIYLPNQLYSDHEPVFSVNENKSEF
jgi:PAS domain S-box-containing protein